MLSEVKSVIEIKLCNVDDGFTYKSFVRLCTFGHSKQLIETERIHAN